MQSHSCPVAGCWAEQWQSAEQSSTEWLFSKQTVTGSCSSLTNEKWREGQHKQVPLCESCSRRHGSSQFSLFVGEKSPSWALSKTFKQVKWNYLFHNTWYLVEVHSACVVLLAQRSGFTVIKVYFLFWLHEIHDSAENVVKKKPKVTISFVM